VVGSISRTLSTTSSVLAPPFFSTLISTARCPETCTMLVCGELPSRTLAMSRRYTTVPRTVLIGRLASCSNASGLLFITIGYSIAPIFAVPVGRITFCRPSALPTSRGDKPHADKRAGSKSTTICRCLPPYGQGICAPGTVAMSARMKFVP
jgi:hypothetical protein